MFYIIVLLFYYIYTIYNLIICISCFEISHITKLSIVFQVRPARATAEAFDIRLNALDFKDLQDKITRPIIILENITFHKTLLERFINTFKEEANKNPVYSTAQVLNIITVNCSIMYNLFCQFILINL